MGSKPWDIGAGGLLVREAAGRGTSTEPDVELLSMGTIVASNGLLHDRMLRTLREADDTPSPQ
jgi:myo-inositol-1(or 4)-monophosphatase